MMFVISEQSIMVDVILICFKCVMCCALMLIDMIDTVA